MEIEIVLRRINYTACDIGAVVRCTCKACDNVIPNKACFNTALTLLETDDMACTENILQLVSPFFFNVTFYDPVTNGEKTLKMYCGDRTAEPYWVDANGKPTHYLNCKVNLIDTGMTP